jgi:transposase
MRSIPRLGEGRRKQVLRAARASGDPVFLLRCTIFAGLCAGRGPCLVAAILGCARSTVGEVVLRYRSGGLDALRDGRRSNGARLVDEDFLEALRVVLFGRPTDFGWKRTTWTRELLAIEMKRRGFPLVSVATMSRALRLIRARRGTPRPILVCPWPAARRRRRLREIQALCRRSTDDEPVFHVDEVDLHLNPKVGLDWMNRGDQRWLLTPGQNAKHYLAGARRVESGKLVVVDRRRKTSVIFCALIDRLLVEHSEARMIHLVCDNFIIHSSKATRRHLAAVGERIALHFLPPYCPQHNPIERVWQDLHANVTRNHRCPTMKALLASTRSYLRAYNRRHLRNPALRRQRAAAA